MANRYAVATGNWAQTSTWSTTDGGTPGASAPGASDNAFLTVTSGPINVTVAASASIISLDCTGYTGTLTTTQNSAIFSFTGNVTLGSGMTLTNGGTFLWRWTGTGTLTTNGIKMGDIRVGSVSPTTLTGNITLADNLTFDSSGNLDIADGNFSSAGFTIDKCSDFTSTSSAAHTRVINLTNTTITCYSSFNVSGSTGLTLTMTGSNLIINVTGIGTVTFNPGGFTFNNVTFNGSGSGGITIGSQNSTINQLTVDNSVAHVLTFGTATHTLNLTPVWNGTSANHITLRDVAGGGGNVTFTCSSVICCYFMTLSRVTSTNPFYAGSSTNSGSNSGITFANCPAGGNFFCLMKSL